MRYFTLTALSFATFMVLHVFFYLMLAFFAAIFGVGFNALIYMEAIIFLHVIYTVAAFVLTAFLIDKLDDEV